LVGRENQLLFQILFFVEQLFSALERSEAFLKTGCLAYFWKSFGKIPTATARLEQNPKQLTAEAAE
jgi:hypothetical protein